jgi:hypothetical protein
MCVTKVGTHIVPSFRHVNVSTDECRHTHATYIFLKIAFATYMIRTSTLNLFCISGHNHEIPYRLIKQYKDGCISKLNVCCTRIIPTYYTQCSQNVLDRFFKKSKTREKDTYIFYSKQTPLSYTYVHALHGRTAAEKLPKGKLQAVDR